MISLLLQGADIIHSNPIWQHNMVNKEQTLNAAYNSIRCFCPQLKVCMTHVSIKGRNKYTHAHVYTIMIMISTYGDRILIS
jgi:hypothetical protein